MRRCFAIEIKVPKEIRSFHESVFLGLSMRQFVCSLIGVAAAVAIYFGLADVLGRETVSWLCVLAAAPFAVAGFFSYNSLTLEKFLVAWARSEFLCAGPRRFVAENYYWQMLKAVRQADRRKMNRAKPRRATAPVKGKKAARR